MKQAPGINPFCAGCRECCKQRRAVTVVYCPHYMKAEAAGTERIEKHDREEAREKRTPQDKDTEDGSRPARARPGELALVYR